MTCPRCGGSLIPETNDGALRCRGCGQPYRFGAHLDLLTPGKRPANEGPGDTPAMVRRRLSWERRMTAHHGGGEGLALRRYLDLAAALIPPCGLVLDLGCGTGMALRLLGERLPDPARLAGMIGFDISPSMVDAARRVLRHEPRAFVARASTRRRLPLRDGSIDVVLRRLAPALPAEVLRVLRPGGAYVTASFGAAHWRELYDALPDLPRPRDTRERAVDTLLAHGFASAECRSWRSHETISPADAIERLLMGPAAFHLDRERTLGRLAELAAAEGTAGLLRLTTHSEVAMGIKSP